MEISDILLQIFLILLVARLFGEVAAKCSIPSVIGELLAGVILGPSLLNLISPSESIQVLAEIGIILLLFEVGLETNFIQLKKTKTKPFIVAVGGVIVPFFLGYWISSSLFHLSTVVSVLVGSTLTATSIGITMRVLTDLKKQSSEEAQIVLGAAVLDDIIGIILLSVVYEFSTGSNIHGLAIAKIVALVTLFLVLSPIAAKLLSSGIKHFERKSALPGLIPTLTVAVILLFAYLAHVMGAPMLLGGFAAGLALSPQFMPPLAARLKIDNTFVQLIEEKMKPIIHLFVPIFFVSVGLSLNLREVDWHSPFIWLLSLTLLLAAVLGKIASGFFLIKDKSWLKWAVGIAMIPRGEVGLIFAELGKTTHLLTDDLYASLLIVIAATTLLAPFAMRYFYVWKRSG